MISVFSSRFIWTQQPFERLVTTTVMSPSESIAALCTESLLKPALTGLVHLSHYSVE